jgi:hypothetical protein
MSAIHSPATSDRTTDAVATTAPDLWSLTLVPPSAGDTIEHRARRAREGVAVLRTRLSATTPSGPVVVERVFWLDPFALEVVVEDGERAVAGTRLEVQVDPATPASVIARVRARLARLQRRGISVDVRRARRAA